MQEEIEIPIRPVSFARPRKHGNLFFNDPKYSKFKRQLATYLAINTELQISDPSIPMFVECTFVFKRPVRPKYSFPARNDTDNLLKAFCDAANYILWKDDMQVVSKLGIKEFGQADQIFVKYGIWEK